MIMDIISIGAKLIDKILPNTEERDKAKAKLTKLGQQGQLKELESAMKVLQAEINGESWLQRNWRPLVMVTFTGLIVAKWLGFTAGVTDTIETELLGIVKVGLGGYVIGRSAEKVMKEYKK